MIWGASSASEVASLDVLISRIRRKVARSRDEEIIRTIRGLGYAWALARSNPI
jgi:DNA-binding response OmpR family regulator